MKKCPFCAEEIQDEAIKCKHCGSSLEASPKVLESETISKNSADTLNSSKTEILKEGDKTGLKVIGIIVLIFFSLAFWYVAIPAGTIWYLFKKNKKFTRKTKIAISLIVTIVSLTFGAMYLHEGRAPSISVLSPENNFNIQASSTVITGTIDPVDAELTVNGGIIDVFEDGNFSYFAELGSEVNQFTFEVKNSSKVESATIVINRIFTEQEKQEREERAEKARAAQEEQRVLEIKEKLQKEIDSLDSGIDMSQYRDDVTSLQLEIVLFNVWATMVREHKGDKNQEVVDLVNKLERKVSALQVKEFPLLRKNYAETLAKKMWENNIEVDTLGGAHKTIQFTGGIFANNANKAEIQGTVSDVLKQFRFTQANYRWYEYDDEFTYYTIESVSDGEVVVIE